MQRLGKPSKPFFISEIPHAFPQTVAYPTLFALRGFVTAIEFTRNVVELRSKLVKSNHAMAPIYIQILVTNECRACVKVLQIIHQMRDTMPGLSVEIFNLDDSTVIPEELSAVIVPATYVNKQLFAYGEFEPLALMNVVRRFIKILPQNHKGERP